MPGRSAQALVESARKGCRLKTAFSLDDHVAAIPSDTPTCQLNLRTVEMVAVFHLDTCSYHGLQPLFASVSIFTA
eukprot:scaffold329_cov390-Pavlova_lutheri.AAC.12